MDLGALDERCILDRPLLELSIFKITLINHGSYSILTHGPYANTFRSPQKSCKWKNKSRFFMKMRDSGINVASVGGDEASLTSM